MTSFFDKFKVRYKKGQYIFKDRDIGTEMFIIQSGRILISKYIEGKEYEITVLEKGDFFGEMAVLENLPRTGNAKAVDDCELIVITGSTFDKMIKSNIEIAIRMLRGFSARLREANSEIERLLLEKGVRLTEPLKAELHSQARSTAVPTKESGAPPLSSAAAKEEKKGIEPSPKEIPVEPPEPEIPEEIRRDQPVLVAKGILKEFNITQAETTIGRVDPVTGLKPAIDLSAEDINRFISRRHAKIVLREGKYFLAEEVGVTNGTFLNGRRLQTGVYTPIKFGDELCFGKVFLTFESRASESKH